MDIAGYTYDRPIREVIIMRSLTEKIRQLPLTKIIALFFSLYSCLLIGVDTFSRFDISDNSTAILRMLLPVVIGGYFGKSGYEHGVEVKGIGREKANE